MAAPRFQASADRALSFFKHLRVPDMPGKPTFAEVGRPWQFEFVAELFGGLNPDTKTQTIREALLLVSKKNYKTGMGAGIILTAAHLQERDEAELLLLAGTRLAAGTAFRTICGMVRADDELAERYKANNTSMVMRDRGTSTQIKVISLANATAAGSRASFVLVDELWTMGKLPQAEGALQEATGGLTSRPEGFCLYLTTQSDEPPAGVFLDRLSYARKVKSGEVKDSTFLPLLYELPKGFNWRSNIEKAFELTNPNLGASVSLDYLLSKYKQVKDDKTGKLPIFLSKHINLEVGLNLRTDGWAGAEFWDKAEIDLTLDELIERCEVIEVGADGGGLDDLLGVYVLGREKDTRNKLGWGHAWCNKIVLQRRKEISPRLRDFEAAGELSIVETGEDLAQFVELVEKIRATGKLHKICVDGFSLGGIPESLMAAGMDRDIFATVAQGFRMTPNVQACERWLASGELFVARQALMRWCVGNARIVPKGNGVQVDKAVSGKAKIDPLISLFNATFELAKNPPAMGKRKLVFFTLE